MLLQLCPASHSSSCKFPPTHRPFCGSLSSEKGARLLPYSKRPAGLRSSSSLHRSDRRALIVTASSAAIEEDCSLDNGELTLPALPFKVNTSLTVKSWGTIKKGSHERKYWSSSQTHPYPVGFTSIKLYKGRKYRQEIKEGHGGPLFVVEDDKGDVFSSHSLQKVWDAVVEDIGSKVHGGRHFGFQCPAIVEILQNLAKNSKENAEADNVVSGVAEVLANVNGGVVLAQGNASKTFSGEGDHVEHVFAEILEEEEEDTGGGEEEEEDLDVAASIHEVENENVEDDEDEDAAEEEGEDEDVNEDDHDEVDHLSSFNVYSGKDTEHDDDSQPFRHERGHVPSDIRPSFVPRSPVVQYDRVTRNGYGDERYDYTDEGYRGEIGQYPSQGFPRARNMLAAEKQVWRKGEGLTTYGVSYGKPQMYERPGNEQWSSFNDGQSRTSHTWSPNGVKLWDGTSQKKRDDNSKSSQLLLELLQRWNKMKKRDRNTGDRFRDRKENKQLHSREEISASEYSYTASRSPSFRARAFQDEEGSTFPFGDDRKSVLDELRFPNEVNESTDYAISRLFEMVGKKSGTVALNKSHSRGGTLAVEQSKLPNYVEKNLMQHNFLRPTKTLRSLPADVNPLDVGKSKGMPKLVDFTENRMTKSTFIKPKKDIVDETMQSSGRINETLDDKNALQKGGSEDIRLIEDVRKMVLGKKFEDALSAIKRMKLSGMIVNENVYEAALGLKLDLWQRQVSEFVRDGNSVLVSAPGGAGKSTAVECCLYRNVVEEQQTLFVTPYEGMAAVKLAKFVDMFGHSNVGSLGAKMSVKKDHKLVVLTLQALAKMLQGMSGASSSEFSLFLEGVKLAVFDKFHTFGQAEYANLWEEVLMLLDSKIKVVALTLPAKNEDQVAVWMDLNRGPCKLVNSRTEPVPKRYLFGHNAGLLPLLDSKSSKLNDIFCQTNGGGYDSSMTTEEVESFFGSGYDKTSLQHVLSLLEGNAMLPAAVAFFNVKCCGDAMLDALGAVEEGLLSNDEIAKVGSYFDELKEGHQYLLKHIDEADREGLCKGVATCHEGKLPMWQHFVLKLFHENLVKLLILTESMLLQTETVARTIILPASCKVTKDGVSSISSERLLQLIGSAGRRGFDVEGNVVLLKSFHSGPEEAASLLIDNAFNLSSCFKPSYSLVVNLLTKHNLSQAKKILGRSFRDFVFNNVFGKARRLEELDREVIECLEAKADLEVKLFQGLAEVNKQKLQDAAVFTRVDIRMNIHSASLTGNSLPGVLLAVVPGQTESFYMVFGADNNFRLLPAGAFDHVYTREVPPLNVAHKSLSGHTLQPPHVPPKESWSLERDGTYGYISKGNSETKKYAGLLMEYPVQTGLSKEGLNLRKDILEFETRISSLIEKRSSLQMKTNSEDVKHNNFQFVDGTSELDESETVKEALSLLKVLEKMDALAITSGQEAHIELKPSGMLISRLLNVENALWLAVVMLSKLVKHSLPAEFLGIISTVVSQEPEVASLFTEQRELTYRITKPVKDAFANLEVLRKQVAALQGSYTPPLHFDPMLAGMVYAWARAKPGSVGFDITSLNDGDILWKLQNVARAANLVCNACSELSMDLSESDDFAHLSLLAKKGEEMLLKHLTAVGSNT